VHEFAELGAIGIAVLMGLVAYRRKSVLLGVGAVVVGGVGIPVILLAVTGFFLFPIFFGPGKVTPGRATAGCCWEQWR
jgi:hypothetical protein